MEPWTPLSGPYTAPNGLTVEPAGSDDELRAIGDQLRNGLSLSGNRNAWADLCRAGRRQIFGIRNAEGRLAACGELKVRRGVVRIMFVRGQRNAELVQGTPEFDAVADYVAQVNASSPDVPLNVQPRGDSFSSDGPAAGEAPWDRAIRLALQRNTSPFAALISGTAEEPAPEQEVPGEITWTPLTDAYTARNGITVEPVGSRSGLREIGIELENNFFLIPSTADQAARGCAAGTAQFCAISTDEDGLVAFSELRAVNGQLIPVICRGFADQAPTDDVASALMEWVAAVNGRQLETQGAIGPDGFAFGDAARAAVNPFAGGATPPKLTPTVPMAMRNLPDDGVYPDYDDGAEDGWDGELEEPATRFDAVSQLPAEVEGPGRLVIALVDDGEELLDAGERIDAALDSADGEDWEARRNGDWLNPARSGPTRIVAVFGPEADAGEALGVAEFEVCGNHVSLYASVPAEGVDEAEFAAAVQAYLDAANRDLSEAARVQAPVAGEAYPGAPRQEGMRAYRVSRTDGDGITWSALTDAFEAPNGLVVEPVTSEAVLAQMGEEFDNALASMHRMWAEKCARGASQIVRILDAGGRMVANAETSVRSGRVEALFNRTANNADASPEANEALDCYLRAINRREITLLGDVSDYGFRFAADPAPAAPRQNIEDGNREDFVTWQAISGRFEAPNGLVVEPVSDEATLQEMGHQFQNALAQGHRLWAERCRDGRSQIVRILDQDGRMVANSELHSYNGVVRPEFNRARYNAPASEAANEALDAYCRAVTLGEGVEMNGRIEDYGFRFDEPGARPQL